MGEERQPLVNEKESPVQRTYVYIFNPQGL